MSSWWSSFHLVKQEKNIIKDTEINHCLQKALSFLVYGDFLDIEITSMDLSSLPLFWIFMKHYDTYIVKANNQSLRNILLKNLTLFFLMKVLIYISTL